MAKTPETSGSGANEVRFAVPPEPNSPYDPIPVVHSVPRSSVVVVVLGPVVVVVLIVVVVGRTVVVVGRIVVVVVETFTVVVVIRTVVVVVIRTVVVVLAGLVVLVVEPMVWVVVGEGLKVIVPPVHVTCSVSPFTSETLRPAGWSPKATGVVTVLVPVEGVKVKTTAIRVPAGNVSGGVNPTKKPTRPDEACVSFLTKVALEASLPFTAPLYVINPVSKPRLKLRLFSSPCATSSTFTVPC
jgi:hypothetical protein